MEKKPPFVRNPYNYDRDAVSLETGLVCLEPTLTSQEFKDEADINTIVRKFGLTGELPQNVRAPVSGDFSQAMDYQQAMNEIVKARESFMTLPADIRYNKFRNDPHEFVNFCSNEENWKEMGEMGMLLPEAHARRKEAYERKLDDDARKRLEALTPKT